MDIIVIKIKKLKHVLKVKPSPYLTKCQFDNFYTDFNLQILQIKLEYFISFLSL